MRLSYGQKRGFPPRGSEQAIRCLEPPKIDMYLRRDRSVVTFGNISLGPIASLHSSIFNLSGWRNPEVRIPQHVLWAHRAEQPRHLPFLFSHIRLLSSELLEYVLYSGTHAHTDAGLLRGVWNPSLAVEFIIPACASIYLLLTSYCKQAPESAVRCWETRYYHDESSQHTTPTRERTTCICSQPCFTQAHHSTEDARTFNAVCGLEISFKPCHHHYQLI